MLIIINLIELCKWPTDFESARKWYEKAATHGSIDAMCALGYMYHAGDIGKIGDQPNVELGQSWFDKATELLGYKVATKDSANSPKRN